MKRIIIQNKDWKASQLMRFNKRQDVKIEAFNCHPIFVPYYLMLNIIKLKKPTVFVFRYLNDYKSLIKTLIRLISEIFIIIICIIFRVRISWIAHNVDRETKSYHSKISHIRRKIISYYSKVILVTDPLLIKYAEKQFNGSKKKIKAICFGKPRTNEFTKKKLDKQINNNIIDFIKKEKNSDKDVIIGYCAGHASWKTIQYDLSISLIEEAEKLGYKLRLILIGDLSSYYESVDTDIIATLKGDPRVYFINKHIEINEYLLIPNIDFFWRAYKDYSVPYSIYSAAHYNKPVLTYDIGFLAEAVKIYNLGFVINNDFSNLDRTFKKLVNWDKRYSFLFIRSHNWNIASKLFVNNLLP